MGLQLGVKVMCAGSFCTLWSCIRTYNVCSNALMYLWSRTLLCGDVESNPDPTNGNVDISVVLFSTVVLLELLFMISYLFCHGSDTKVPMPCMPSLAKLKQEFNSKFEAVETNDHQYLMECLKTLELT